MMKKVAFIVPSFMIILCASAYYYWKQFTHLPEWYVNQTSSSEDRVDGQYQFKLQIARQRLEKNIYRIIENKLYRVASPPIKINKIPDEAVVINLQSANEQQLETEDAKDLAKNPQGDVKQIELKLNEADFNHLVRSSIARSPKIRYFFQGSEGFRTTIKDGKLEGGAIINFAKIPAENLGVSERGFLENAVKAFPFLLNRDIYIGIEGTPTIEEGKVKFDENTHIKFGNLSLSIADLSTKLGIPEATLAKRIDLELKVGSVQINDLEFNGDRAVVRGFIE